MGKQDIIGSIVENGGLCLKTKPTSVSYTHLDVYKRQDEGIALFSSNSRNYIYYEKDVIKKTSGFVLVAKIEKPSSVPLNMKITPKEGEGDRYENLPCHMDFYSSFKTFALIPIRRITCRINDGDIKVICCIKLC